MKINIGYLTHNKKDKDIESFNACPDYWLFDTEWFKDTKPSVRDTDYFLPPWEDATDLEWVFIYFITECASELLENNRTILCKEALKALESYVAYLPTDDSDGHDAERLRQMVELQKLKRKAD